MVQRNGLQQFARGFLPATDPLAHLPKIFSAWENLANDLPKLLMSNQLRQTIEKMPTFPTERLRTIREHDRAMVILSFIGHAYVWGEPTPIKLIPKVLAQPWYEVAKKCGRPPVLSYVSYALNNWRRINPDLPIELGNIALLQNFHGGQDEEWFVLIHVAIEAAATPAISAIILTQQAMKKRDTKTVAANLHIVANTLHHICDLLDRMPERCDPYIYYQRVRPYIHGWKGNQVYPQGLIYEGVADYQLKPQQFRGETGAQSTIIPALDGLLNISHQNDILGEYLKEMRLYMPPLHRTYLETVEQNSPLRDFVLQHHSTLPALREDYNKCIELVTRFRSTHLHYAARYIHQQSQTGNTNPAAVGTGGTPFMEYLKKHYDETMKFVI